MKKLFFTLLTLLFLIPCVSLPVLGEEITPPHGEEAESITEEASPLPEDAPAVTDTVITFLDDNGDTLLSALGVVVSLLLALLYKSGLLPLVSRGLKAISESSDKAAGITFAFAERASDTLDKLESTSSAALSRAEETAILVKGTEEVLAALQEALTAAQAERGRIAMVLAEETALFYELLNSVKLPEAQKDVIRERYYRYQTLLEDYDKNHDSVTKEGDAE